MYQDTYNHIVDVNILFIYIQNDLFIIMILLCYTYLEMILEYEKKDCYTDNIKNFEFIILYSAKFMINMSEMHLNNNITVYGDKTVKVAVFTVMMQIYSDYDKTVIK